MEIKHILKDHAYQNIPLTFEEAYTLGCFALEGCDGNVLAQFQSIAALSALHTKATYIWQWSAQTEHHHDHHLPKNAAEQIAGVCAAIFQQDIAKSKFGFLQPQVPYAMDNCGMGGDLIVTANVSTLAALIAAAAGITMCKHGSPANADSGRHGSSDFIASLGINTYADSMSIQKCIETENFGYTEALDVRFKRIHLQTHTIAKLPHMNDLIGPITNPIDPHLMTRRIVGVNHLVSPRIIAEAYQILNQRGLTDLQHGLFVRGFVDDNRNEGVDEVSICPGGTQVAELKDGNIREYYLTAENFGLQPIPPDAISPPSGMNKGDFSLGILRGEINGSALNMILANAALLFYLADPSQNLRTCYAVAKDIHSSGATYRKVLAIRDLLPQ